MKTVSSKPKPTLEVLCEIVGHQPNDSLLLAEVSRVFAKSTLVWKLIKLKSRKL